MSKNIDILFISPGSMPLYQLEEMLFKQNKNIIPCFETPTGLIELASYTRNKFDFVNFQLLDLAQELFMHHHNLEEEEATTFENFCIKSLDNIKIAPDIVGISILFSSSYISSLKLIELIKQKWPNTKIILGGGHVTFYHRSIFDESELIDYIFIGESELSFEQFISEYRNVQLGNSKEIDVDNIVGLYDRKKTKKEAEQGHVKGTLGVTLQSLEDIGLPAYDLLNLDVYKTFSSSFDTGAIGVMMERGCPFKCTYCASMVIHGAAIRSKSNQQIIDELLYLRDECNFKNIILWDDLLAAKKKKFTELTKRVIDEKVNEGLVFSMPSGLSVRVMNEELLTTVCSWGYNYVRIMIESGSEYAQKHIVKKMVNLDKAREQIAHTRKLGVKVETNILFGFPHETKVHMQETIDYIKTIDIDWIQVFALLPLPGTEAYNEFVSMGKLDPNNIDWDRCGYSIRIFDTEDITSKELSDLVYDVNIYTNFFGNRNMLQGRYERAIMYFNNMVLWKYKFHIPALYQRATAYIALGRIDEAEADLKEAIHQIKTHTISRQHWDYYGSEMPMLHKFLDVSYHKTMRPHPPSVDAGFVL